MEAHAVQLKNGTSFVKVRSNVWPVVWTVLTLGIYGFYWWYQVNRELRDLGRIAQRPELGDSPGTSLLAVTLGALIIVPPFVSLYRGFQRIQAAQELAGIEERERLNGWIGLALVAVGFALLFVPIVIAFIQSELNKVWQHPSITDYQAQAPAGAMAVPVAPVAPPAAAAPAAPRPRRKPAPPRSRWSRILSSIGWNAWLRFVTPGRLRPRSTKRRRRRSSPSSSY